MPTYHVCPWWLAYTFDNPLRSLIHKPEKIFAGLVREGMTVMDIGCGMGFFTIGLAEIVGESGRVIAVDLQQQMLDITVRRATKKGLAGRIITHRAESGALGCTTTVDFVLAFWMVHEVPDPASFFREVTALLKPGAGLLYAEPVFHVSKEKFKNILAAAESSGLQKTGSPAIRFSHAALLEKTD